MLYNMNNYSNQIVSRYPVALFLWRRSVNLDDIIGEIKKYGPSHLYIFVDGARNATDQNDIDCVLLRCSANLIDANFDVTYEKAEKHLGLHNRYRTGIDILFHKEPCAIILEDDTIPAPFFFDFCAYYLKEFYNREDIVAINGILKNEDNFISNNNVKGAFTHHIFNPWGWASWSHKILPLYNPDIKRVNGLQALWVFLLWWNFDLLKKRRRLLREVEIGKLNTWDVQLQWSIFLKHKKVLTSPINLITNVGNDQFASTFVAGSNDFNRPLEQDKPDVFRYPIRHIAAYDKVLSRAKSNYRFFIKLVKNLKN